jgi:hypothetical protein
MRLVARSIRTSRDARLIAAAGLLGLLVLFIGRAPIGYAAEIPYTITPGGPSLTITISTAGDNAAVTFDGTQGQRIAVDITSVTIGSSPGSGSQVTIKKPDGSNLTTPRSFGTLGFFVDTVSLPSSGTYTIYVDPQSSNTGSATLTAYDVPADLSSTITPGGNGVSISLTTPGRNAALTFEGAQDQRVSVNITSVTIGDSSAGEAYATIKKPDGSNLTTPRSFGTLGIFLDTVSLPSTGTYTIYIDPQGANTGNATVIAYDVPADLTGSIGIAGGQVSISLMTPGRNARLGFEAAAGQIVRLTMSTVTIGSSPCCSAWASIESPGGTTLVGRHLFGTVGSSFVRNIESTGTHSVLIDPVDASTGGVTLALSIAAEAPVDGAIARTLTPSLRVDPATPPNTDYYFEIATDPSFTSIVDASGPFGV